MHTWTAYREVCTTRYRWEGDHWCPYESCTWVPYTEAQPETHWSTVTYPMVSNYTETHVDDHTHTTTYSETRYNVYDHTHVDTISTNHAHLSDHLHEVTTTTNHVHVTTTPTLVAGPPAPQTISADDSNPTYKMPQLTLRPAVTLDSGVNVLGSDTIVWPLQHWLSLGVAPTITALPYAQMPDGTQVPGLAATVNSVRYYGATKAATNVSGVLYDDAWLSTVAAEEPEVIASQPSLGAGLADPARGSFLLSYQGTARLFFLVNTTMVWADGTTTTLDLPASFDVRNATAGTQ
jgi:hypothetical protein